MTQVTGIGRQRADLEPSGVETVDAEILDETPGRPGPDAQAVIDGLVSLAAMIEQHPELVDDGGPLRYAFDGVNVYATDRAAVAALARMGTRAGAKVVKHQGDKWAGVDLHFGNAQGYTGKVSLHVFVEREEICERIVTGTRKVTEEVPDPEALAAVPKVTVTKTVEDVEWRCHPILAAELPGGAS